MQYEVSVPAQLGTLSTPREAAYRNESRMR